MAPARTHAVTRLTRTVTTIGQNPPLGRGRLVDPRGARPVGAERPLAVPERTDDQRRRRGKENSPDVDVGDHHHSFVPFFTGLVPGWCRVRAEASSPTGLVRSVQGSSALQSPTWSGFAVERAPWPARSSCSPGLGPVSYTHLRAHETRHELVCRLLLDKKKKT